MKSILIAGLGNIHHGDDAFGCEVVRQLDHLALREEVAVEDFGIRNRDLACALTNGYGVAILVGAVAHGQPAGTLCLLEPDLGRLSRLKATAVAVRSRNPVAVIRLARSFGAVCDRVFLVGCEPAVLENAKSEIRLSQKVEEAMPLALATVELLVEDLLRSKPKADEERVAA